MAMVNAGYNFPVVIQWVAGAWFPLGDLSGYTSVSEAAFAIDPVSNIPYLGIIDGGKGSKITVLKWANSAWQVLGVEGFTPGSTAHLSLDVYNGVPYVAFQNNNVNRTVSVMKFE